MFLPTLTKWRCSMKKNELLNSLVLEFKQKHISKNLEVSDYLNSLSDYNDFLQVYKEVLALQHQCFFDIKNKKFKDQLLAKTTELEELQKKYEIDVNKLTPQYDCPICEDRGVVNGNYCDCLLKEFHNRKTQYENENYKFSRFNKNDKDFYKDNTEILKVYDVLKKWAKLYPNVKQKSLNFFGDIGTGKTHIMECIASELIDKGFEVCFTTAFNLNNEFKKYHFGNESKMDDYLKCDALFIDDLGTEPIFKNVTIEYLLNLIDIRQKENKSIIVSSNLMPDEIQDRYEDRILSRLLNKRMTETYLFTGKDTRIKTTK